MYIKLPKFIIIYLLLINSHSSELHNYRVQVSLLNKSGCYLKKSKFCKIYAIIATSFKVFSLYFIISNTFYI